MPKITTAIALAIILLASVPSHAEAWCWNRCTAKNPSVVDVLASSLTSFTKRSTKPVTATATTTTSSELVLQAWTTAYTYFDNDPPGSATISNPIIHKVAGGVGTYADPITIAVGYTSAGPDIKPGTKFYIPNVKRYFIVEDTCAGCHPGHQGLLWIDLWIDGAKTSAAGADACASLLTDVHNVIQNPKATYPVVSGVLSSSVCATQYGEKIL